MGNIGKYCQQIWQWTIMRNEMSWKQRRSGNTLRRLSMIVNKDEMCKKLCSKYGARGNENYKMNLKIFQNCNNNWNNSKFQE